MAVVDELRRVLNDTIGPIVTALTKTPGAPNEGPPRSLAPNGYSPPRVDIARILTMNKYYLDDQRLEQVRQWAADNNVQSESAILGYVDGVFFPAIRRTR
jgi:hypothetical protein